MASYGEITVDARILRTARKGTSAGNPLIVPYVPIRECRIVLMAVRYCTRTLPSPKDVRQSGVHGFGDCLDLQ